MISQLFRNIFDETLRCVNSRGVVLIKELVILSCACSYLMCMHDHDISFCMIFCVVSVCCTNFHISLFDLFF